MRGDTHVRFGGRARERTRGNPDTAPVPDPTEATRRDHVQLPITAGQRPSPKFWHPTPSERAPASRQSVIPHAQFGAVRRRRSGSWTGPAAARGPRRANSRQITPMKPYIVFGGIAGTCSRSRSNARRFCRSLVNAVAA
jgi:hypothetical protein